MVSTKGEKVSNLTVKKVEALVKGNPGKTSDGNRLSFVVPKRGEPYWSLRYFLGGKRREKPWVNIKH